jgi:hypothetical protein
MEAATDQQLSAKSPSGAIQVRADTSALEIRGNITFPKPFVMALGLVPLLAFVTYFLLRADSLLSAQAIVAYGLLAFSMWTLNASKRETILRFARDYVELTETLLFSTRQIRARLDLTATAETDAIQWEDWREDLLRVRIANGTNLYVLKRHSMQDLEWVGAAIEQWFNGGPHNKPLKLSWAVQARRTGTDRFSGGTRNPFRGKRKRQ